MNWKKVKLKDITEIITKGTTPTTIGYSYTNEGVNFIKIESITDNGAFLFDKMTHISLECHQKMSRSQLKENDIIFSIAGAIGKTAIVSKEILPANTNQALAIIRLNTDEIDVEFLFRSLRSEYILKQFNKKKQGVAQLNLSLKDISELEIVYPSLTRQKEIVKILNKAQSLIGKRKEQLKFLDELVKSQFIEMFGDPVSNSKEWDVVKLGKISSVGSSKRVFVDELVNEGIPFYRGTEIGALSTGEKIEPTLFITKEHYEKLKDSTGVPVIGDLLMPSICPDGRIWSVDTEMPFYFKDGRVLWIHLENSSIDSMFLKHMLREKFNRDYNKIASGTTFAELKIFALKDLDIIMPPIEIQKKYSNFVKQTEKLKFEMENSLKELEDNFNSLMKKAFNGELLK